MNAATVITSQGGTDHGRTVALSVVWVATILAPAYSSDSDATFGWWTRGNWLAHDFLV